VRTRTTVHFKLEDASAYSTSSAAYTGSAVKFLPLLCPRDTVRIARGDLRLKAEIAVRPLDAPRSQPSAAGRPWQCG